MRAGIINLSAAAAVVLQLLFSQVSITHTDPAIFIIDFDNTVNGVNQGQYLGTGFNPLPDVGQIDSDAFIIYGASDDTDPPMQFGDTRTEGDFARGIENGGTSTGGIWSFQLETGNLALGLQPTASDFTPGSIVLRLQNDTGQNLTHLTVEYDIIVLNDQNRSSSFDFSYSEDDESYNDVPPASFTSGLDPDMDPQWITEHRSFWIHGLSTVDGGFLYLKWTTDDVAGSGSRDQIAIDNIQVSAGNALHNQKLPDHRSGNILKSFPNPFNPELTITIDVSVYRKYQVELYNLTGKHIDTLHKGYLQPGRHSLIWDASDYPSGYYLISLIDGESISTSRVLLIK